MAQTQKNQSAFPNPEIQRSPEQAPEIKKTSESLDLRRMDEISKLASTPEAQKIAEAPRDADPKKYEQEVNLMKANLIGALVELIKVKPDLKLNTLSPSQLPAILDQLLKSNTLELTPTQKITISKLQESGQLMDAVIAEWPQIQTKVHESYQLAEQIKAADEKNPEDPWYKRWPKQYVQSFKEDPWKTTLYTGAAIAGTWATWKLVKWALGKGADKTKEHKWSLGLGGIGLLGLGLFLGKDKIKKALDEMTGLKLFGQNIKEVYEAIKEGNWNQAWEIVSRSPDRFEEKHQNYSTFIKEKTGVDISPASFKAVGQMTYATFRKESPGLISMIPSEIQSVIEKNPMANMSLSLLFGSDSGKKQGASLYQFFSEKLNNPDDSDFSDKTVDEVMEMIMINPDKYIKSESGPESNKKPETMTAAAAGALDKTAEDIKVIAEDLKGTIPGIEELYAKYEKELKEGAWYKDILTHYAFAKDLAELIYKNKGSIALKDGMVLIWDGTKIITHRSLNALWEPMQVVFSDFSLKEAGYSYVEEAGSLIVFGATLGAVSGLLKAPFRGKSLTAGFAIGAARGAVTGGILPIKVAKMTLIDAVYHGKRWEQLLDIKKKEIQLAKEYAKKTVIKTGQSRTRKMELEAEYRTKQYDLLERKFGYYQEMHDVKIKTPSEGKEISEMLELTKEKMEKVHKLEINEAALLDNRRTEIAGAAWFKKSKPEIQSLIQRESEGADEVIRHLILRPHSKLAESLMSDPKFLDMVIANDEFRGQILSAKFINQFEEISVRNRIMRILSGNLSPEKQMEEMQKTLKELSKKEIISEKFLETDPALKNAHVNLQETLKARYQEYEELSKKLKTAFEAALKENPGITMEKFLETDAGRNLKAQMGSINEAIEQATKAYPKEIARIVSNGQIDDIAKLPKDLKKRAFEFIINSAGDEIPLPNKIAGKLIKSVGGRLLILAPIIALKAYTHEEGKGSLAQEIKSAGVSLVPVAGTAADFYAAATGKDYFTQGEVGRLSAFGWGILGIGMDFFTLFAGAGEGARLVLRGGRIAQEGGKIARAAEAIRETAEAAKAAKGFTMAQKGVALGHAGMLAFTVGQIGVEFLTTPKEVASFEQPE